MLKDRAQKATALKLSVAKLWLPYLEVEVESTQKFERSKFLLTDIDVLSVAPGPISGNVRLVFDCKSSAKESAIGRAFWLHGVMTRASAAHGFVVLNPKVSIKRDHRVSASDLGVTLLHETEFEELGNSLGGEVTPAIGIMADIDAWDYFQSIGSKYSQLSPYLEYSKSVYWTIKDSGEQCRKTVARLRAIRMELDPSKPDHVAVFGDATSQFILALSQLVSRLFLLLIKPSSQEEYSSTLMSLLYGGWDNLEAAQKIRRLAGADEPNNIFPEIERFEHLVREFLQAPTQVLKAAILAREFSFAFMGNFGKSDLELEIARRFAYAPKFVLMSAEYLQRACKLPPEFANLYVSRALDIASASLPAKD
jgi:hypothetical protein